MVIEILEEDCLILEKYFYERECMVNLLAEGNIQGEEFIKEMVVQVLDKYADTSANYEMIWDRIIKKYASLEAKKEYRYHCDFSNRTITITEGDM